ncbi:MAG: hypothetical protein ACPG6B_04845, partial [Oceanihabitans sp.]
YQSFNEILKIQSNYIYEYSLLVNNEDIFYLAVEDFNNVSCYAIQLPDFKSFQEHDLFTIDLDIKNINYYNIETGLLVGTKTNMHNITDYKENNEYLKDSDEDSEMITLYSNYKEYNGVLFATIRTLTNNSKTIQTKSVSDYVDIIVNPTIDKNDYKVEK